MTPMVIKLARNARYDGQRASTDSRNRPGSVFGTWIARINSVMAMAKTPSLNASMRAVSLYALFSRLPSVGLTRRQTRSQYMKRCSRKTRSPVA